MSRSLMMSRPLAAAVCLSIAVVGSEASLVSLVGPTRSLVAGGTRQIDTDRSTLTVNVYKSGLFSAFADDHVIQAPIAHGSVSDQRPLAVELVVHAADLRALDPGLAPSKRAEVQTRMLSAQVLDVAMFPDVTFTSTSIEPGGTDRWMIAGRLTIHGRAQPVAFAAAGRDGSYHGSVELKQSDFGIEPISIAGGTVKVKDKVKVEFDIVVIK
jgi:uncharacterized protein with FMN-binding domain